MTGDGIAGRKVWTFNSLSRDHAISYDVHHAMRYATCFQLPLSGSQIRPDDHPWVGSLGVAFNSLSRDHSTTIYRTTHAWAERAFNSLSRDHRARFRDFSALRGFLPRPPFARMISKTTIWIYRFAPL